MRPGSRNRAASANGHGYWMHVAHAAFLSLTATSAAVSLCRTGKCWRIAQPKL